MRNEKTIEQVAELHLPTDYGEFLLKAYHDQAGDEIHLALVRGEIRAEDPVLVRVHMEATASST